MHAEQRGLTLRAHKVYTSSRQPPQDRSSNYLPDSPDGMIYRMFGMKYFARVAPLMCEDGCSNARHTT